MRLTCLDLVSWVYMSLEQVSQVQVGPGKSGAGKFSSGKSDASKSSPGESGSVRSDFSVVLDDSGEPDDLDFWVSGFEILPQVFW